MSTFVSKISLVTGKQEWVFQDSNYDYHQEVARSAYADMLHDTERNQKYEEGLQRAVAAVQARGQAAHVLDIGTGTGLLAMMAVRCGADRVTACEAFQPMAACARQVMRDNGVLDQIRLIAKRSTELTVGPGGDLPEKANILVTEVFDTELIGEGAIGTFQHAHKHLLQKDCIVVPSAANMYVQVVESEFLRGCHTFRPISIAGCSALEPPAEIARCPGAAAVHDLQLTQLSRDQFTPITQPMKVFRFDYSGASEIASRGSDRRSVTAVATGRCDAVLMWWDLEMDTRGDVVLSCAPHWAHPTPDNMQWRDHWMQAVYYPQTAIGVEKGEGVTVESSHDDYSLSFNVTNEPDAAVTIETAAMTPACRCGVHMLCSRTRISMLNDCERNAKYAASLAKVVVDKVCLFVGDGSLLPLMAARLGAKKVYAVETHPAGQAMLSRYIEHNRLQSCVTLISKEVADITSDDLDGRQVEVLAGEPHCAAAVLPWHHLAFWAGRTVLAPLLAPRCAVLPATAAVRAVAVDFDDLWKIRAPVGACETFRLAAFDRLIAGASDRVDERVEPQPLWEYPGRPLTDEFGLIDLDLQQALSGLRRVTRQGSIALWSSGSLNGVALWMEYGLDAATSVSTGLRRPPAVGQPLSWHPHARQAVYLLPRPRPVTVDAAAGFTERPKLKYSVTFEPKTCEFSFEFSLAT